MLFYSCNVQGLEFCRGVTTSGVVWKMVLPWNRNKPKPLRNLAVQTVGESYFVLGMIGMVIAGVLAIAAVASGEFLFRWPLIQTYYHLGTGSSCRRFYAFPFFIFYWLFLLLVFEDYIKGDCNLVTAWCSKGEGGISPWFTPCITLLCYGLPHHEQDKTYLIEENVQYFYSPM